MVTFDYKKTPITQIADYIIMYAAKSGASDIHFDPKETGLMVRIRVDGELQDYTLIPTEYERNLTTRLKLLANMNITESRLPQDGAIKRQFGKLYLDMRASSLPTNEGEKIVIRILDYSRSLQGLEHLGFSHANFLKLKRMIEVPSGIILVTGATGTGKSTTTYSILQALNRPETNIITVEDPIEMNIEGMNQVQVNSEIGLTFATVLRSILRQDPNIILIGEIRDSETAKIAVRASITGHLVLSTIHTNNSLSTIERLLDMDVERYLLSSALTGIISQRLAKMLCPKCKIEREATNYEKKIFKNVLGQDIEKLFDANHDGCDSCHNGYKGRIAVQEVLEIDDDIRDALNDEKLEKEDLRKMVYTSNVITLLQDGLEKVLEGKTSFEEIYRIIEIDSDSTEDYGTELAEVTREQINTKNQKETKEQTNTAEVTKKDSIATPQSKTVETNNLSNSLATTTTNDAESIISQQKEKKEKKKSDIIIMPPSISISPEPLDTNYNNNSLSESEENNMPSPSSINIPMGNTNDQYSTNTLDIPMGNTDDQGSINTLDIPMGNTDDKDSTNTLDIPMGNTDDKDSKNTLDILTNKINNNEQPLNNTEDNSINNITSNSDEQNELSQDLNSLEQSGTSSSEFNDITFSNNIETDQSNNSTSSSTELIDETTSELKNDIDTAKTVLQPELTSILNNASTIQSDNLEPTLSLLTELPIDHTNSEEIPKLEPTMDPTINFDETTPQLIEQDSSTPSLISENNQPTLIEGTTILNENDSSNVPTLSETKDI